MEEPKPTYPLAITKLRESYGVDDSIPFPVHDYFMREHGQVANHLTASVNNQAVEFLLDKATCFQTTQNIITDKAGRVHWFDAESYKKIAALNKEQRKSLEAAGGHPFYGPFDEGAFFSAWFRYKNTFIFLTTSASRNQINVYWGHGSECDIPVDKLREFSILPKNRKIKIEFLVADSTGRTRFEELDVPELAEFDLALNYGAKFEKHHDKIVDCLVDKKTGLIMFHGEPGTGKTSYIKYLASLEELEDRPFLFIPASLTAELDKPAFMGMLLDKKNAVIILEDAEAAILERGAHGTDNVVSVLLNLADGILGSLLNFSIILTYNTAKENVDEALLRKGRLLIDYRFDRLSIEESQKLLDHLGKKHTATKEMTLAEIYNQDLDNNVKLETKSMGFGP